MLVPPVSQWSRWGHAGLICLSGGDMQFAELKSHYIRDEDSLQVSPPLVSTFSDIVLGSGCECLVRCLGTCPAVHVISAASPWQHR